ncbi:uncharacterized protein LOC124939075 [Impatiens glandulifera]|uniref:uncharacterized protein LOC124939075 n=1 Tax=Impatiens glandulifera TaxID=253017 RepID=UPI001FB0A534|nr:uncharacterized protein LOC124939075 [Impatiens glandulifera]
MIQLLFPLVFAEMALIIIFVFKTLLRKPVIRSLDRVKRDRGPIIVKAVAGTILAAMVSRIFSMMKIQKRYWLGNEEINSTSEQLLLSRHLLEASLMGFSLFLGLMIERLHHYIRELDIRRKTMKKQNQVFEDGRAVSVKETEVIEEEMAMLRAKVKKLELDVDAKTKEVNNAEENVLALKNQSNGFLLEYDRLFEDNQNLRSQLKTLDRRLSHSDSSRKG